MFRSHFFTAVRSLSQHKAYAAINVVGLACALATAVLVCAMAIEELRYVNYHENGHRIFAVLKEVRHEGGANYSDWVSGGTTVALRNLFPEIEVAARAHASQHTRRWLRAGDKTLSEFFCRADPELLDVFGFDFVRGGLQSAAMTAVVTESVAYRFFGTADPIGKTITLVDAGPIGDYTITGVLKDISHYAFIRIGVVTAAPPTDFVNGNFKTWEGWNDDLWGPKNYVLLPEGFPPETIEQALNDAMVRSVPQEFSEKMTLHLRPMDTIRLHGFGEPGEGTIHTITFFLSIAIIVAAVACANFVNLAVARIVARTRDQVPGLPMMLAAIGGTPSCSHLPVRCCHRRAAEAQHARLCYP